MIQAQNYCHLCQNGIPAWLCFVSFDVCIGLAFSYFVSSVSICFWEESFALTSAICLFKLVGNFKILQSAPYASISAAISVTDFQRKSSNRAGNVFYEIVGCIFSYNNIWEYFELFCSQFLINVRLLWLVSSEVCTALNPVKAFFPHHILTVYNHDNSINMTGKNRKLLIKHSRSCEDRQTCCR